MKIGIVIVNWNGGKDTCECLASLSKIHLPDGAHVKVMVVDNASSDNSVEEIQQYIESIAGNIAGITFSLQSLPENEGFSGGNNKGISALLSEETDYIMLLNNDVVVHKDFLSNLMLGAGENMIIGPKIYFAPGYEFHKTRYKKEEKGKVLWYAGGIIDWRNVYCFHRGVDEVDSGRYNKREETQFITGCCMLFHKNVVRNIGLLDDKYFLYYEDVDFCLRAKQKGVKLVYEPLSILWHKNAQSSGSSGSAVHVYYQTRNRLLFGMRYAPIRARMALIRESIQFLVRGGIRRRAIVDFLMFHYGQK